MRSTFLTSAGVLLLAAFSILAFDFYRLFQGSSQGALSLALILPVGVSQALEAWAGLDGSTWGNFVRLLLRPLMVNLPLWMLCLILAVGLRLLAIRRRR